MQVFKVGPSSREKAVQRASAIKLAQDFTAALSRRDVTALTRLFAAQPSYSDPTRPGLSQGTSAVTAHLAALCESLADAVITPLDVLVDHESACVRWMAQLPAPRSHALDAVTWMRLREDGIEEAHSYFDASVFFEDAKEGEPVVAPDARMAGMGEPVVLRGQDSRNLPFDLAQLRGRVVVLLAASRSAHEDAQLIAQTLGDHFGGNPDVLLVFLLDATDIPKLLRPVARSAMATLRAQAVRRFREGFEQRGRPVPRHVEDMVWFVPDYDGTLFNALSIRLPLQAAVVAVMDQEGRLRGVFHGPGGQAAHKAAEQGMALLG